VLIIWISFDINASPLVGDPDRFYRSGEKSSLTPALNAEERKLPRPFGEEGAGVRGKNKEL
jgi:hypothetical protein